MISASGDRPSIYPATNVYNFGFNGDSSFFRTWCTVDFDSDHPYIDMRFTSPVLITDIICSGTNTLRTRTSTVSTSTFTVAVYYYVTNFTIEFSPPDDNTNLTYYTTEEGSNIQVFDSVFCIEARSYAYIHLAKSSKVYPKSRENDTIKK